MFIPTFRLLSLSLSASLVLSACTVDAQLASQLLSTLQASAQSSTARVKTSASAIVAANDAVIEEGTDKQILTRPLQISCGGAEMRIASLDEAESVATESAESTENPDQTDTGEEAGTTESHTSTESQTENPSSADTTVDTSTGEAGETTPAVETVFQDSEAVAPVVLAAPDPVSSPEPSSARVRRVKIRADLQAELKALNRVPASERARRFASIREKYPEMRHAIPVQMRVRGRTDRPMAMTQVIFVQMSIWHAPVLYIPDAPGYRMPSQRDTLLRNKYPQPTLSNRRVILSGRALLEGLGDSPCASADNEPVEDTTQE